MYASRSSRRLTVTVMSRPFWLRMRNSKSAAGWSEGAVGRSNSMPVNGKRSVTRRSSTVQCPWIGSDDDDIGIRMCIVANPLYCRRVAILSPHNDTRPCKKWTKCRSTSDTLQELLQFGNYGNDAKNKWDFSLVLKVFKEFDDVTSAGKLFHVRAAATGNARSPTVHGQSRRMSVIIIILLAIKQQEIAGINKAVVSAHRPIA